MTAGARTIFREISLRTFFFGLFFNFKSKRLNDELILQP